MGIFEPRKKIVKDQLTPLIPLIHCYVSPQIGCIMVIKEEGRSYRYKVDGVVIKAYTPYLYINKQLYELSTDKIVYLKGC